MFVSTLINGLILIHSPGTLSMPTAFLLAILISPANVFNVYVSLVTNDSFTIVS